MGDRCHDRGRPPPRLAAHRLGAGARCAAELRRAGGCRGRGRAQALLDGADDRLQHHLAREGIVIQEGAPQRRPLAREGQGDGQVIRAHVAEEGRPGDDGVGPEHLAVVAGIDGGEATPPEPQGPGDVVATHDPRQREILHAGRQRLGGEEAHPAGRPQAVEGFAVPLLAARERKPLQDVPVLVQEALDQRGAVDGAGHADHRGHAGDDLRVRGQGFEHVDRPFGVRDHEQPLARPKGHRHERVAELPRIVRAARASAHPHDLTPVALGLEMDEAVAERDHRPLGAVAEQAGHHGDAKRARRGLEDDRPPRRRALSVEADERVLARPVVGQRPAVVIPDGAPDLPEARAAVDHPGGRRRGHDLRRDAEVEGQERAAAAAGGEQGHHRKDRHSRSSSAQEAAGPPDARAQRRSAARAFGRVAGRAGLHPPDATPECRRPLASGSIRSSRPDRGL